MTSCLICGRDSYLIQCSRCQRHTCEFCITLISQIGWEKRQYCLFCGCRFKEFFRKRERGRVFDSPHFRPIITIQFSFGIAISSVFTSFSPGIQIKSLPKALSQNFFNRSFSSIVDFFILDFLLLSYHPSFGTSFSPSIIAFHFESKNTCKSYEYSPWLSE